MTLTHTLFEALDRVPLVDPHSHIDPRSPASTTIADLLGYHYYTELAHSAGMPRERIEEPGISPEEKVARLFEHLHHIDHSVQWSWFVELSRELFGFEGDCIGVTGETFTILPLKRCLNPTGKIRCFAKAMLSGFF